MGREQNRAMLHALTWRIRAIPENRRPKLLVFGGPWGPHHAGCLLARGHAVSTAQE